MMMSFTETWTSVYVASPRVSWLQTKTIAVHGAAPRRIMPAMYSRASAGSTQSTNKTSKKSRPEGGHRERLHEPVDDDRERQSLRSVSDMAKRREVDVHHHRVDHHPDQHRDDEIHRCDLEAGEPGRIVRAGARPARYPPRSPPRPTASDSVRRRPSRTLPPRSTNTPTRRATREPRRTGDRRVRPISIRLGAAQIGLGRKKA